MGALYEHSLKKEKPDDKTTTLNERNGDDLENSRCLKLYRAYSISILRFVLASFLDLNFKRLYRSSGKRKENRFRLFTSSKNVKLGTLTKYGARALTANKISEEKRKKSVLHRQRCCCLYLNPFLF